MNSRLLVVILLLFFILGCSGGSDDGGTTGGSGDMQPLTANNITNGDWSVVETYKNGETYQWQGRFLSGGRLAGGGSWRISEGKLYIRNVYSYWVAEDLSNSRKFVAKGPVSDLSFLR